jgi:hypothetical protein
MIEIGGKHFVDKKEGAVKMASVSQSLLTLLFSELLTKS